MILKIFVQKLFKCCKCHVVLHQKFSEKHFSVNNTSMLMWGHEKKSHTFWFLQQNSIVSMSSGLAFSPFCWFAPWLIRQLAFTPPEGAIIQGEGANQTEGKQAEVDVLW